jgi:small subunit ribosomal protein S19
MSRSKWKGLFLEKSIINLSKRLNIKKNVKVYCRSSSIPNFLINKYILIHNGKEFKKNFITRDKIGFKFGEFSPTIKKNKIKKIKKK